MVDRDVRRTRRVVQHAPAPCPAAEPPAAEAPTPEPSLFEPTGSRATSTGPAPAGPAPAGPASAGSLPEPRADSPYSFPTEALLENHIAAADELRADLDRLRRQLDDGPPPLAPARRRSRKPLLGVLVVGGTLAAIATAVLIPWSDLDLNGDSTPSSSAPAAAPTVARPGSAAPSAAAPATPAAPAAPAPRAAPAGSLPASGPGVSEPGTMMVVEVASDGSLTVTEQAVLGPRGLREISLRLPSMASLGGQVAELSPTVHKLRVAVNGTPVQATPTADGPGWVVVAAGKERARTVQLSYQIQDAIVRSTPSESGRALGVSLPLLGQALREQGLPLVVRALGSAVGGATCPSAPPTMMLCGEDSGDGWLATIPTEAASPTLLLQLNLAKTD